MTFSKGCSAVAAARVAVPAAARSARPGPVAGHHLARAPTSATACGFRSPMPQTLAPQRITLSDGKTIDLKLPNGVEDGTQMRLKGKGEQGPAGAGTASSPSPSTATSCSAVWATMCASTCRSRSTRQSNGGKVRVPTVDGPVMMTLKPGTDGGSTLRLKGKGFTRKNGTRGDQLVTLEIQLPADLAELAKRLDGWKDESDPRSNLGA